MISRHWKGVVKDDQSDAYVAHLEADTFPQLEKIPGFVRASILRRPVAAGIEFQIVTVWESLDAIRGFAGDDPERAVVPPVVREMMHTFDERAVHYELVETANGRAFR